MIPPGNVVDGIGGDDAVEGRQREPIGDVRLEQAQPGAGKAPLHVRAQGPQAGLVPIDGDDCRVWTRYVAEGQGEGAAAGAEIGPDAAPIPLDRGLDQPHVIVVVHQTTPPGGLTRGGPGSKITLVY